MESTGFVSKRICAFWSQLVDGETPMAPCLISTAILLIISYNSASLVKLLLDISNNPSGEAYVYIAGLPLLLLGIALLQVVMGLSGLRHVTIILTWSSSSSI
jgi:hypothetical protein